MMSKIKTLSLFVIILSALLLITSSTSAIVSPSTTENVDMQRFSNQPLHLSPPTENSIIVDSTVQYAQYHRVTKLEAKRRLALQEEIREIYREIQALPTFGGLWLEHEPDFKIVIQSTVEGQELLQDYQISNKLRDIIEFRSVTISLAELQVTQANTWVMIRDSGLQIDHDINIAKNQVELYLAEPRELLEFLQNTDQSLPAHVQIIQTEVLSRKTANIYGGLQLFEVGNPSVYCTTGFSVMHQTNGLLGVTTAGHCPDAMQYLGVQLPWQNERDIDPYDVQWHTSANHTPKNWVFNGQTTCLL